jgi:hypothetical protein
LAIFVDICRFYRFLAIFIAHSARIAKIAEEQLSLKSGPKCQDSAQSVRSEGSEVFDHGSAQLAAHRPDFIEHRNQGKLIFHIWGSYQVEVQIVACNSFSSPLNHRQQPERTKEQRIATILRFHRFLRQFCVNMSTSGYRSSTDVGV